MPLDDPVDHGQAKTGAQLALGREERLEDAAADRVGNADAGVGDLDPDPAAVRGGAQAEATALGHRVDGVEDDVDQRLAELRLAATDGRDRPRVDVDLDRDAPGERLVAPAGLGEGDHLLDQPGEIDRPAAVVGVGGRPVEGPQPVDNRGRVGGRGVDRL